MSRGKKGSPETVVAVLASYASGLSMRRVAELHAVAESTVCKWVQDAGISRSPARAADLRRERVDAELALTGGRWVSVRGVHRWVPFVAPSKQGMSDRERRIEAEEAMFDDDEARDLHARYFNGCREHRTVVGERVYQRRKKRAQTARKVAA